MRRLGMAMDAPSYVDAAMYDKPIEELSAEELANIPSFLLDPWLAEQEGKD